MKKITKTVIIMMMLIIFITLAPDTITHIIGLYVFLSGKMVLDALDEL